MRRAVLDFALYRHQREDPLRYELAVDAAGWLFFDGEEYVDDQGRYTFMYICKLLEIDARRIRDQALALTRTDLRRFNGDTPA